ncbi:MAG: serine/threonine-protein kinase [Acidobacteriota bacterium]
MVGKTVQQYQFLEKLGAGGMGEIYRAQDTRLNRYVAVKVLTGSTSGDPERRRRFIQEAQAASALNHPNIITIHDIITEGDAQFMVMEHVQGKTLSDLIPKGGLRVPQVLKLSMQMTDALQTAHAAGIIHRDLKPGNVMVTETGLVKILDFGLAKLADPSPITQDEVTRSMAPAPLTVEGSIIGTVSYMSPEQAQGMKVDTRSDIFSLGVVLYEMLTGVRAFVGDTAIATLSSILRDDVRPLLEVAPDVPTRLEQVISRCLKKSPDDRFQTMKDMHLALGALKHESDSGVLYRSVVVSASQLQLPPAPVSQTSGIAAPAGKNNKAMIGIAAGVVAVLAIGGVVWTQMNKTPEPAPAPAPVAVAPPPPAAPVEVPPPDETLTNDGIIQMIAAKVPMDVLYSQLRTAPNKFDLSASAVIKLSQVGVPLTVIESMRDPKKIPASIIAKAPAPAKSVDTGKQGANTATSTPAPAPATVTPAPPTPVAPAPVEVAVVTPPAPAKQTGATHQVTLADGTPFSIALNADVPDDAKEGTQLRFAATSDVKVADTVVIAKGALATGQIAQEKGRFGKKMTLWLLTVDGVDGKKYKIRALSARGNKNPERPVDTGKSKADKVVATAGTEYIAYVDGEMKVTVRGGK